ADEMIALDWSHAAGDQLSVGGLVTSKQPSRDSRRIHAIDHHRHHACPRGLQCDRFLHGVARDGLELLGLVVPADLHHAQPGSLRCAQPPREDWMRAILVIYTE